MFQRWAIHSLIVVVAAQRCEFVKTHLDTFKSILSCVVNGNLSLPRFFLITPLYFKTELAKDSLGEFFFPPF